MIYILLIILNILDYIFTLSLTKNYGLDIESNPIGKWILGSKIREIIFKILLPTISIIILYINRDIKVALISTYIILIIYLLVIIKHLLIKGWILKYVKNK